MLAALAGALVVACAGAAPPGAGTLVGPREDAPARGGGAFARVVVEVFSDFECPFCARVGPAMDAVLARYGPDVRLVWRDYPLERHPHARLAAEAAREARAQGGDAAFWRFHDALFARQGALSREALEALAEAQDLDLARFRAALDRGVHAGAVRADMRAADATGVPIATPLVFINGRLFEGEITARALGAAVERALAQAR